MANQLRLDHLDKTITVNFQNSENVYYSNTQVSTFAKTHLAKYELTHGKWLVMYHAFVANENGTENQSIFEEKLSHIDIASFNADNESVTCVQKKIEW